MTDRRSIWAWGMESSEPTAGQRRLAAAEASRRFGLPLEPEHPPRIEELKLRPPRIRPPATLLPICSTDSHDRASHSYGHSFRDRVRKFDGSFDNPPDIVARPVNEEQVVALLDYCASAGHVVIPFGGGSSVVGGVEPPEESDGVVSVDLTGLDKVLEVDTVSQAARIQGGTLGPVLEAQLKPYGVTLRHFPQSFEFSTLGGWIATRSGGHFATNHTHIDDLVESVRMMTPAGPYESRRLPGSGAGPSPDRLAIGSEGILGIVTEAWVRLHARPRFRAGAGVTFPSFEAACNAARSVVQSRMWPANCRVLDPLEAQNFAAMDGSKALLILGFESADIPQEHDLGESLELARDAGGSVLDGGRTAQGGKAGGDADPVRVWRDTFINMPYKWNETAGLGLVLDTFESAITWDRWPEFDLSVRAAVRTPWPECAVGENFRADSHTCTRTDRPPITPFTPRGNAVRNWKCGLKSRKPPPTPSLPPEVRSPITTPWEETTDRGTTVKGLTYSPTLCARQRTRWTQLES